MQNKTSKTCESMKFEIEKKKTQKTKRNGERKKERETRNQNFRYHFEFIDMCGQQQSKISLL